MRTLLYYVSFTFLILGSNAFSAECEESLATAQVDYAEMDLRISEISEALYRIETPLALSDMFGTGPLGMNLVRSARESNDMSRGDLGITISDDAYIRSTSEPGLIDPNAVRPVWNMVMYGFNRDIFRNEFFKNHDELFGESQSSKGFWSKLIENQPWLRWDNENQTYVPMMSGAQDRILDILAENSPKSKIHLVRGTVWSEVEFMMLLGHLDKAELAPAQSIAKKLAIRDKMPDDLKNQLLEVANLTMSSSLELKRIKGQLVSTYVAILSRSLGDGSLFVTPNIEKGVTFSKGALIEFEVSLEEFRALAKSGQVYLGIEDSVEIAFIGAKAIEVLAKSIVAWREQKPVNGNIFSSNHVHPVWGSD